MYIQFMVEDQSGGKLIETLIEKYKNETPSLTIEYDIKFYKGLGNFNKGKDPIAIKSEQLLSDLPKRIRAFNVSLRDKKNSSLFIIIDNDRREPGDFRRKLEESIDNKVILDHVFCIAVEEIEAWLLGDVSAIVSAYLSMKDRINTKHSQYKQDEIRSDGTWEFLFDLLRPPKKGAIKKEKLSFVELGKYKFDWAGAIGLHMNIRRNASPSFKHFIGELDRRRELVMNTSG